MDDAARAAGPTAAARTTADLHRPTDRPAGGRRPGRGQTVGWLVGTVPGGPP